MTSVGAAASLPTPDHAARRARVRARLETAGVERLLVTGAANVRYLTGFTGSSGQVLVDAASPGDDRLITDGRYRERAAIEAPGIGVVIHRDAAAVALDAAGEGVDAAVPSRVGHLGVESEHLSWAAGERFVLRAREAGVVLVPTRGVVEAERLVKDDAEIARLARACAITELAMAWLFEEVVAAGRTERALAVALERRFGDLGADGVGFASIVASGPNSAVPHHDPGDRPLADGDLLTVDCGAVVDGYHADCTRTVAIGGIGAEHGRIHEVVCQAQQAGRAAVQAGVSAGEVDAAAREVIAAAGFAAAFVHGTGHGVGLEIHEAPAVARKASATLQPGVALTVEPGIYLPGSGGVRIEDTLVVVADAPARALTDAPRHLRVL